LSKSRMNFSPLTSGDVA